MKKILLRATKKTTRFIASLSSEDEKENSEDSVTGLLMGFGEPSLAITDQLET